MVMKPGFKICRNKHIREVCGKDYSIALTKFSDLSIRRIPLERWKKTAK